MIETVRLIEDLTDRALGRSDEPVLLSRPPGRSIIQEHLAAMVENARVNEMPEPAGRSRFLKRLVLRLTGFTLVRQRAMNQALLGVVNALVGEADHLYAEIEQERRRSVAAITAFEMNVLAANKHHRELVERLNSRITELSSQITPLNDASRSSATQLANLIARIDDHAKTLTTHAAADDSTIRLLDDQSRRLDDVVADLLLTSSRRQVADRQLGLLKDELVRLASGVTTGHPTDLSGISSADLTEVYERFEAAFRPSGADLNDRFRHYLGDLEHLKASSKIVLDVGTGRGDFLSVLSEAGIPSRGIDSNPEAVKRAVDIGLDVTLADAFEHFASLPDESLGAVTALHVVEHIEPNALIKFVDEIFRTLVPGGTVIFETPNPTNLSVGASSFYHDPTHQRPVTPDYLAFLLRDRGLTDVETRFLHPLPEFERALPSFDGPGFRGLELLLEAVRWALKGPQDYAVVGRRPGER